MPDCGTQVILCDLPIRFDTYSGCTHGCEYCFAQKKKDISDVDTYESVNSLKNFIEGKRTAETRWCDWNIPIHWGGLSDPFQPCEKKHRQSKKCLEYLKETQYPFVVSTKGKLAGDPEYIDLLAQCNCVVQISLVDPSYDKYELGCPTFDERLEIIRRLTRAGVKRVNVRCQPYVPQIQKNLIEKSIPLYAEAGVHGLIVEGFKSQKKRAGMVKVAGDLSFPVSVLQPRFAQIKKTCHEHGLVFYVGENRLREMGDSLCCCGIEGLEGFRENTYNFNHFMKDKNGGGEPTRAMKAKGSAMCFRSLKQTTAYVWHLKETSFEDAMKEHKDLAKQIFEPERRA